MDLANNQIHIWSAPLDLSNSFEEELEAQLSPDEHLRAQRLRFDEDRRRFIIARVSLRHILSFYTEYSPQEIQFEYNEHNKPMLSVDLKCPIHFNVSHSADLAVYAISRKPVGIDIEQIKPSYPSGLPERFFSQHEWSSLKAIPDNKRTAAFYNLWARKEAIIKASGAGLAISLASFSVSTQRIQEIITLADKTWHLQPLAINERFASALASEHLPIEVLYYDFDVDALRERT